MTDLTACYFCGATGAAEERDAVPAAFDPPAAVQQTVVLCPTCREKLTAVLEPVFERESDDGGGDEGATATGSAGDSPAEQSDGEQAGEQHSDAPEEDGHAASANGRFEDGDGSADDGAESADAGPDADGGSGGTDAAPGGEGDDPDPPEDYHTVLRFLRNRELPVDREEVRTVVASAYDLGQDDVDEILDAAVQRGVFLESDGTLARSRDQL